MRRVLFVPTVLWTLWVSLLIPAAVRAEGEQPGRERGKGIVGEMVGRIHETRTGGTRWSRFVGAILPRHARIHEVSILARPNENRFRNEGEKFDVSLYSQSSTGSLIRPTFRSLRAFTTLNGDGEVVPRNTGFDVPRASRSWGFAVYHDVGNANIFARRPLTEQQEAEAKRGLEAPLSDEKVLELAREAVKLVQETGVPVSITARHTPTTSWAMRSEVTGEWEHPEYTGSVRLLNPRVLRWEGDGPDGLAKATTESLSWSFNKDGVLFYER